MTDPPPRRRTPRLVLTAVLALTAAAPFACCGGVLLAFGRTTTVRRDDDLPPTPAGPLVFQAWSYGDWTTASGGWHKTYVEGPPYTLVLAATCDDPAVRAVELTAAELIGPGGAGESVLGDLTPVGGDPDPAVDELERHPTAALKAPYASWQWRDRFPERNPLTLRVRARLTGGPRDGEAVTATLHIPLTETRSTGWTYLEMLAGV